MPDDKKTAETTIGDLMEKIVRLAGVDDSLIPIGRGFAWFGMYDRDSKLGPPITIKLGEKSPFNGRMGVVAMFQNETEVRVYSVPVEKPEKNEVSWPTRHTLNKQAPTFFFEALPQDVFEAEIADELCTLDEETAFVDKDDDGELLLIRPKDLEDAEPAAIEPASESETKLAANGEVESEVRSSGDSDPEA
jgi:hypothetical protein